MTFINLYMCTHSLHLSLCLPHRKKAFNEIRVYPWMQRGRIDFRPAACSGGCTCAENLTQIQLDLLPELFDPTSRFHCICPDIDMPLFHHASTYPVVMTKAWVNADKSTNHFLRTAAFSDCITQLQTCK